MSSAGGRTREEGKAETRRALVEAAAQEFAERGLDAPSLDAICARAGFTRGAFYVHFEDREDLLAAVMEYVLGRFMDAVIATGEAADDLETTIRRYVAIAGAGLNDTGSAGGSRPALFEAAVPFHQILASSQRNPAIRSRLVAILAEAVRRLGAASRSGQRARAVRSDVDADSLAALLLLLAIGVRAAADLRLPLDVARVQQAALRLLAPPDGS